MYSYRSFVFSELTHNDVLRLTIFSSRNKIRSSISDLVSTVAFQQIWSRKRETNQSPGWPKPETDVLVFSTTFYLKQSNVTDTLTMGECNLIPGEKKTQEEVYVLHTNSQIFISNAS